METHVYNVAHLSTLTCAAGSWNLIKNKCETKIMAEEINYT